jgi:hypothetical protein
MRIESSITTSPQFNFFYSVKNYRVKEIIPAEAKGVVAATIENN